MPELVFEPFERVNKSHPLNRGLVNWWYPVEGLDGGKFFYDLVGNNHADLNNATGWSRSPVRQGGNTSIRYTAASSQYSTFNQVSFTGEFSVCFWYMPLSNNSGAVISANASSGLATQCAKFYHQSASLLFIRVLMGVSTSDTTVTSPSQNVWHHVVLSRDANDKIDITIDGVRSRIFADAAMTGTSTWGCFGRPDNLGTAAQFANCYLDDVRLYNRALSAAECNQLMRQSIQGHPDTLNRRIVLPNLIKFTEAGSGGALIAGNSTITDDYTNTGSGGVLIGGQSLVGDSNDETGTGGVLVGWPDCSPEGFLQIQIDPLEWGSTLGGDANAALRAAIVGISGLNNSSADSGEYRCEITVDNSLIDSGQITIDIALGDLDTEDYDPPFHCTVTYSGDEIDCENSFTVWTKTSESDDIGGDPTPETLAILCSYEYPADCGSIVIEGNHGTGGVKVYGLSSLSVFYNEQTCCAVDVDGSTSVSLTDGGETFFGIYAADVASALAAAVSELNDDFPQLFGACIPGDCSAWGGSGAAEHNSSTAALSFSYGGSTEWCIPTPTGALLVTLTSPGPEFVDISDIIHNMNPAFADPTYGDSNGWNYSAWLALAKAAADTTCEIYADYGTFKFYVSELSEELGPIGGGSTLPSDTRVSCAVWVYPTYIIVQISAWVFMSSGPALGATYDTDGNLLTLTMVDCDLSEIGDTQSGCWPESATVTRSFEDGLEYEVEIALGGLEGGGIGFDLEDNGMIEASASYTETVTDCRDTFRIIGQAGGVLVSGDSDVIDTIPGRGGVVIGTPGSPVLITYNESGHGGVLVRGFSFTDLGSGGVLIAGDSEVVLKKFRKRIVVDQQTEFLNGFYAGAWAELDSPLDPSTQFVVYDSNRTALGTKTRSFDGTNALVFFSCNLEDTSDTYFYLYSLEA